MLTVEPIDLVYKALSIHILNDNTTRRYNIYIFFFPGESSISSSEAVLTAFLVLFIVAILVAGFVILTLALMIRDMKHERIQDGMYIIVTFAHSKNLATL